MDKLHRQIFLTGLHTAVIVPHLFEKGYNLKSKKNNLNNLVLNILSLLSQEQRIFISRLTINDIEEILSKEATIVISLERKNNKIETISEDEPIKSSDEKYLRQNFSLAEIAEQLKKSDSREKGLSILEENFKLKKQLEEFANYININIYGDPKKLNKTDLQNKIIQITIGDRLSSKAIQGGNEVRKSDQKIDEASSVSHGQSTSDIDPTTAEKSLEEKSVEVNQSQSTLETDQKIDEASSDSQDQSTLETGKKTPEKSLDREIS